MEGSVISVRIEGDHAHYEDYEPARFHGVVALHAHFGLDRRWRGCAHPQTVTLTSASTVAAPAPVVPAPVAAAPAAEEEDVADGDENSAPESEKAAASKDQGAAEPVSFAALSAALGDNEKLSLDMTQSTARAGKGLSSEGYAAVNAPHQAVETESSARAAGDIKVSGGLTAGAVRTGVREGASRLRACYQHGLAANPRLAGRVTVSFSVDAHGAVSDIETQSDAIPGDVAECVKDAFSSMTFTAPRTAPAKIVYPVDPRRGLQAALPPPSGEAAGLVLVTAPKGFGSGESRHG